MILVNALSNANTFRIWFKCKCPSVRIGLGQIFERQLTYHVCVELQDSTKYVAFLEH